MLEEFPTCNAEYDLAVRQPTVFNNSGVGFNEVAEHAWLYSPAGDPLKFLSEDELYAYKMQIDNNVVNGYSEGEFEIDFPSLIRRTMRMRRTSEGNTDDVEDNTEDVDNNTEDAEDVKSEPEHPPVLYSQNANVLTAVQDSGDESLSKSPLKKRKIAF